MQQYVIRRLLLFVPSLLGASLIVFGIMFILPGDVALEILGQTATEGGAGFTMRQAEILREAMGLNDPVHVQYGKWLWSMLTGGFGGESLLEREPISEIVARRFPVTLQLTVLTLSITLLVSIPLGVIAALYQDKPQDYVIRSLSILGLAMPNFWVALLVLLGLVTFFSWSPPLGFQHFWQDPIFNLQKLIWPALVLSWGSSSFLIRVTRAQVLEVLRQDYVRTAYSKGLAPGTVVARHVMRNALLPVITLLGANLDFMLGGSVILENIFAVPGVGQGIIFAAIRQDWPVIVSLAMLLVILTLTINLVIDLTYVFIDPRISYK